MNVRRTQCPTCIYKPESGFDIEVLEAQCRDQFDHYHSYRICHYHEQACCRGFWDRHRDNCTVTQIAQRLGLITITNSTKGT